MILFSKCESNAPIDSGVSCFPIMMLEQNRVTDHRIGYTTNNLDRVMNGDLDDLIEALITEDQKRKLMGEE